jgi:hypothetical protein
MEDNIYIIGTTAQKLVKDMVFKNTEIFYLHQGNTESSS